jgi:hypothetical protein
VGNRDYNTSGAAPYYAYFGAAAGTAGQGYYSYDVGAWHIIVLNGEIATGTGSAQEVWLKSDLAAHSNLCTLAMIHEPLWSSWDGDTGTTGIYESAPRPLWEDMYAAGVDIVLSGHRHFYERIAPIKPDGTSDPSKGIRLFVVGTGGEGGAASITDVFPNSELRNGTTSGVMKLTLFSSSYNWQFIPLTGQTFTDSGSGNCH